VTNRGWFILCLGGALVGIGLVALNFPVFLDSYDQWGWQIKCGTGYSTNLMQAEIASQVTPQTNFVDQCQSALEVRRAWTIPIAVAGWLILSGLAVALWRHASTITETADALP
jgi:hypothetical protein